VAYQREIGIALLGLPSSNLARAESTFYASMKDSACDITCRFTPLKGSLAYSLHVPLIPRSALDSASNYDGRVWPAAALAARDTAMLRKAALNNERNARENVEQSLSEFGWSIIAADAYLQLRDTANALRMARFFVDSAMPVMPVTSNASNGIVGSGAALWPRAMLMRADLAKATGNKAEARFWYLRVLDLWAKADAELQPTIERIRAALVALDTKA
jgi:hypothetical protein